MGILFAESGLFGSGASVSGADGAAGGCGA